MNGHRTVGMKKTLVYHLGRAPHGARTNWVMHEYKLVDDELAQAGVVQDAFVLCRIFEKSGAGPQNGAKYGAPLLEEEWSDEDEEVEVAPFLADEVLNAVSDGAYVETDDLEQKLDLSDAIGGAGFPSSNFYHGECSSHPDHSQVFITEPKPLDMAEQHGMNTNSVIDGDNGELNPLNFNGTFDDLDLYLDAADYLPIVDDGSFLETNDLVFPTEGNPTQVDISGTDMMEEYLAYPDDDISKYISFDLPQNTECENSVPNQGSPFIQQNVEGETTDMSGAVKHEFEAESSNEASSSKNAQESKFLSGNTNQFVKQANKWLASIPAAPAFASEFPSKEIALAQSSNSAHITAGMISITDITLRGNGMDWTMGKNGGFNAIISAGFSEPNVNSASLMPISGLVSSKTAFVLSHGWIFVMGFSVLVLSLSFKIGSIMYTGK
ncbi:NAC domain-containing protein 78 isoform X2 [Abrus precatorius]|nr:NAC domain-containing protein 78 isoform X2 [Abrus precatorius]